MNDEIKEVDVKVDGAEEIVEKIDDDAIPPTEVEEKAAKMGWTSKDKFKGNPDKWRPADEFVERGETMMPILKAQVKRQDREIAELKQSMQQFGEYHTKTEERAYANALTTLREQRAQAIAIGDGEAFDKVDEAIGVLRKDMEQKQPVRQRPPEEDPVYQEWESRNKWLADPEMYKQAIAAGKYLRDIGDMTKDNEFLDKVKDEVKRRNPNKFDNPRRTSVLSVEGGSPTQRKGGKSYADLPSSDKAACERMAKNGFSDPKEQAAFKAEYLKNYEW